MNTPENEQLERSEAKGELKGLVSALLSNVTPEKRSEAIQLLNQIVDNLKEEKTVEDQQETSVSLESFSQDNPTFNTRTQNGSGP
jgi:hypothetical protein